MQTTRKQLQKIVVLYSVTVISKVPLYLVFCSVNAQRERNRFHTGLNLLV